MAILSAAMKNALRTRGAVALSLAVGEDGSLPTEFRIFTAGWNETLKGRFLFDEKAGAAVMSAYRARGVDVMIDLEHQSIEDAPQPDPTARDARGWCELALRGGELWAVNVRWTEDGAARLTQKRQRYVSPVFNFDDSRRPKAIFNIALCANPATFGTPALVAASARGASTMMTIDEFLKVCKALGLDNSMSLNDAIAKIQGAPAEDAVDGGVDDGSETNGVAAAAGADAPKPPPQVNEKPNDVAAACARLIRLTAADGFVAAVAQVEKFRESHLALEKERTALAAERKLFEATERTGLYQDLVKLCGRAPAAVWADDKATTPKAYLAAMSLENLREYVADAKKDPRAAALTAQRPPATSTEATTGASADVAALSAEELAVCKAQGCSPEDFAALKAFRNGGAARRA